mmetsp:Transcript_24891/g.70055  ORF Transcript_24891/g.70055 Transcript_24891/m.70055 type:complete len:304 (-) Transcript_24891:247-1158(-)
MSVEIVPTFFCRSSQTWLRSRPELCLSMNRSSRSMLWRWPWARTSWSVRRMSVLFHRSFSSSICLSFASNRSLTAWSSLSWAWPCFVRDCKSLCAFRMSPSNFWILVSTLLNRSSLLLRCASAVSRRVRSSSSASSAARFVSSRSCFISCRETSMAAASFVRRSTDGPMSRARPRSMSDCASRHFVNLLRASWRPPFISTMSAWAAVSFPSVSLNLSLVTCCSASKAAFLAFRASSNPMFFPTCSDVTSRLSRRPAMVCACSLRRAPCRSAFLSVSARDSASLCTTSRSSSAASLIGCRMPVM